MASRTLIMPELLLLLLISCILRTGYASVRLGAIEVECPTGWTIRENSATCWKYSSTVRSWSDALSDCQKLGGDLVHIKDMTENEELSQFVRNQTLGPVWLGLNRVGLAPSDVTGARWSQQSGADVREGFWDVYQPAFSDYNHLCVESHMAVDTDQWGFYKPNTRLWAFTDCRDELPYVCQLHVCAKDGFRCGNGRCLSRRWLCDGIDDCGNGDDETTQLCPARCEYEVSGSSGVISSYHMSSYPAQTNCVWRIQSPASTQIHLQFTALDTEPIADEIQILVPAPSQPDLFLLASISGDMTSYTNQQFSSGTNQMTVRFQSDNDVERAGFNATWSTSYSCDQYVSKHGGNNVPSDVTTCSRQCDANVTCTAFTVTSGQCQTLTERNVMTTVPANTSIYVTQCAGMNANGALITPVSVTATDQYLTITSPHYPVYTHANMNLTWSVSAASPNAYLMIKLDDLDLAWPDSLTVYEGTDTSGRTLGMYPGTSGPGTLVTQGGSAVIQLITKQYSQRRGFIGQVKQVSTACPGGDPRRWRTLGNLVINNVQKTELTSIADLATCKSRCEAGNDQVCVSVEYSATLRICRLTNYNRQLIAAMPGVSTVSDSQYTLYESLCAKDCPTLVLNSETVTSPDPVQYGFDSEVNISCTAGHVFSMENHDTRSVITITCLLGGRWSLNNIPVCRPVYCPDIPVVTNGYVVSQHGVTYKNNVTYACYDGYTLQGSTNVTCLQNGAWSTPPTCTGVECPAPPTSIANMTITATNRSVGAVVSYQCTPGYQLVGVPRQVCQSDGAWTDAPPTCQKLRCGSPVVINGSVVENEPYLYLDTITINCDSGYQSTGPASATCQANQTFTEMPQCQNIDECTLGTSGCSQNCTDTDGSFLCSCMNGYKLHTNGTTCVNINECDTGNGGCEDVCVDETPGYRCECNQDGYVLFTSNGDEGVTIMTGETGTRPGDVYRLNHSCVKRNCSAVSLPLSGGAALVDVESYHAGGNITYYCDVGRVMRWPNGGATISDGTVTVHCQNNGTWSHDPPVPECAVARCSAVNLTSLSRPPTSVTPSGDVDYGTTVTYTCTAGLMTSVTLHRNCTYDVRAGTYVLMGDVLECPVVDCGSPSIENSQSPVLTGTLYGASFTVQCLARFQLTGESSLGNATVRCLEDGHWDYGNLTCQGFMCPDPGRPLDGVVTVDGTDVGSQASFSCLNPGYNLNASTTLQCNFAADNSSAEWTGTEPICVDVENPVITCPSPVTVQLLHRVTNVTATATDNTYVSGVTSSPAHFRSDQRIYQNTTVVFTATDLAGNKANCSVDISVIDDTDYLLPTITCPNSYSIAVTDVTPVTVSYAATTAQDASGGALSVTFNPANQSIASTPAVVADKIVVHNVVASARASAVSQATCQFQVVLKTSTCTADFLHKPSNGTKTCTPVQDGVQCTVTCNQGYVFYDGSTSAQFTCTNDAWSPSAEASDCVAIKLMPYVFQFQYLYNIRDNNGVSVMNSNCLSQYDALLRSRFAAAGAHLSTSATCGQMTDHSEGRTYNHVVTFTDLTSELNSTSNQVAVNFTGAIDKPESSKDDDCLYIHVTSQVHQGQIHALFEDLTVNQCPNLTYSHRGDNTVIHNLITCNVNEKHQPRPAIGNDRPNALCLLCPAGTSLVSGECQPCETGTYQDEVGQTSCKTCSSTQSTFNDGRLKLQSSDCHDDCTVYGMISDSGMPPCRMCPDNQIALNKTHCQPCPANHRTLGSTTCQAPCSAGSYSPTGYPPCITCPVNSYQNQAGQSTCIECASANITVGDNKTSPSDCVNGAPTLCAGGTGSCRTGSTCSVVHHRAVCTCPTGYTGPLCNDRINPCLSSPCYGNGTCTNNNNGTYSCNCPTGLSGARCEVDTDDCSPNPCKNGAVCLDEINNFTCHCRPGFNGSLCDQVDDICEPNPCQNSGQCVKLAADRYKCSCTAGYTGSNCSDVINACQSSPCLNGAQCVDTAPGVYRCTCVGSFSGSRCEIRNDPCNGSSCLTNGACVDVFLQNDTTCNCNLGYRDDGGRCVELDQCSPDPCQNGAQCANQRTTYTCTNCPSGYEGYQCQHVTNLCTSTSCANSGTCTPKLNGFDCHCTGGWTGSDCSQDVNECSPDPCNSTGSLQCQNLQNGYNCVCKPGYTGQTCEEEINECLTYPCRHNGRCVDLVDGYRCECTDGWDGAQCDQMVNTCTTSPCTGSAQCYSAFNQSVCVCDTGYLGANCSVQYDVCDAASPCLNGTTGRCALNGSSTQCNCNTGFTGAGCHLAADITEVITEDNFTVTRVPCLTGYNGANCATEVDECDSTSCPAGLSTCYDDIFSARCHCSPGRAGMDCKAVSASYDLVFKDTSGLAYLTTPVPLAATAGVTEFSLSFWVRFNDKSAEGTILRVYGLSSPRRADSDTRTDFITINSTAVTVTAGSSHTLTIQQSNAINDGRWHVLIILVSGTEIKVHTSSAVESLSSLSLTLPNYLTVVLGSELSAEHVVSLDQGFRGGLSQVSAWSRTLTNPEMNQIFGGAAPPSGGQILGWAGYRLVGNVQYTKVPSDRTTVCADGFGGTNCNQPYPDKSPPAAVCSDVAVTTGVNVSTATFPATWTHPSDASATSVTATKLPGNYSFGVHKVLYELRDANNNTNFCDLRVYVRARDCSEPEPPLGGSQRCDVYTTSGRSYTTCTLNCTDSDQGLCVPTPSFYTCGPTGWWNYQDQMMPFQYPTCANVSSNVLYDVGVSFTYTGVPEVGGRPSCPGFSGGVRNKLASQVAQWPGVCGTTGTTPCTDNVDVDVTDCPIINITIKSMRGELAPAAGGSSVPVADVFASIVSAGGFTGPTGTTSGVTVVNDSQIVRLQPLCSSPHQPVSDTCVLPGPGYKHVTGANRKCPVGEFQTEAGQLQCQACPNQASGVTTLIPGSYNRTDCKVECAVGERFDTGTTSCVECELDFYQPSRGQDSCIPCGQDKFTNQRASTRLDQCITLCPAGQRLLGDGLTCENCTRGQYRVQGRTTDCVQCPGQFLTEAPGATSQDNCTMADCGPGHYRDQSGSQETCRPCARGSYQSDSWQLECTSCPTNTSTSTEGATHQDNCTSLDTCPNNEIGCSPYADCRFNGSQSSCHCRAPYSGDGKNCQHVCVVDNPCQNSGVCVQQTDGAYCVCPDTYNGVNCEIRKDPGDSEFTRLTVGVVVGVILVIGAIMAVVVVSWCIKKNKKEPWYDQDFIKDDLSMVNPAYSGPDAQLAAYNTHVPSVMPYPTQKALSQYAQSLIFDDDASLAGARPPSVAVFTPGQPPAASLINWTDVMSNKDRNTFLFDDDDE